MAKPKISVQVRIGPEMLAKIDKYAEQLDQPRSEVIRSLLARGLTSTRPSRMNRDKLRAEARHVGRAAK